MSVHRILIVGARRRKQGLGEFIAQYFHEQGAEICGIVGTSSQSVDDTAEHLHLQYGISTQGYTDLKSAIEQSNPTVVVIASPNRVHRQHLEVVASAGISCLCEKPLFWDDDQPIDPDEVEHLVNRFCNDGQLLQLITQWPETLDEYYSIYPEVKGQPVERFEMLLGPASSGINMVIDSLPHVLSMLHCLTGIGDVQNSRVLTKNPEHQTVSFEYRHATGYLEVAVDLIQTPESPRPGGICHQRLCRPAFHSTSRISNDVFRRIGRAGRGGRPTGETGPAFSGRSRKRKANRQKTTDRVHDRLKEHSGESPNMNTAEKQKVALSSIHDFAAKLRQPDTLPRVKEYVQWLASGENRNPEAMPDFAPVSINLDLTTACNYACDHCVDKEILNLNIRYDHQRLLDSLQLMAEKGSSPLLLLEAASRPLIRNLRRPFVS